MTICVAAFPSPIAAAFSADNDLQIGFITEETILDPCKPKIHKIDSINKTKIVAGNVLPIDCNGCCNIVKMKFCALLKLVISKPILTKLKIIKIIDEFLLPVQICFNYEAKKIYVADMGYKKVMILDYDTGEVLDYINIDGDPQGIQISNDYKLLFISDTKNNLIKVYNTSDNTLIKNIEVGKEPTTILCM